MMVESRMTSIKIYMAEVGKCYKHASDNRYLGEYKKMGSRPREEGHRPAPVYEFEEETIGDKYPTDMVIAVACESVAQKGGKQYKKTRTIRRKRRRTVRRRKSCA